MSLFYVMALLTAACLLQPPNADAQGLEPGENIVLELNSFSPSDGGCRATFMVTNRLNKPLKKVAYEIVLFNKQGLVDRLMVLDFSPLSTGKTRVRQFDLPGASCSEISRILINDASVCEGEGLPKTACVEDLETTSRANIEFGS